MSDESVKVPLLAPDTDFREATVHWRTLTNNGGQTFDVLSSTSDGDGDTLTLSVSSATASAGGQVSIVNGGKSILIVHNNWVGKETVSFSISDGIQSSSATITLDSSNNSPVANNEAYSYHWRSIASGVTLTPNAISNDSDPDGDPISYSSVGNFFSLGGSATISNGNIVYTPPAFTIGVDNFNYVITDTQTSSSATISVTMTNTAPTGSTITQSVLWSKTTLLNAVCTDVDSDPITQYSLSSQPQEGSFQISSTTGSGTYSPIASKLHYTQTPASNGQYELVDSFGYSCSDGVSSGSGSFQVTVYNTPPVTHTDYYTFQRNRGIANTQSLNVIVNDTDPDGESISLQSHVTSSSGADVSVVNGQISYTPVPTFAGTDTLTYSITDGNLQTTGTVYVSMVNNPPVCSNLIETGLSKETTYKYYLSCSDVNGDPLSYNIPSTNTYQKGSVSLGNDQNGYYIAYTSNPRRSGNDVVTWTVSDGFVTVNYTLTVTIVNLAPNQVSPSFSYQQVTSNTVEPAWNMLNGVSDPDLGDSVSLQSFSSDTCGSAAGSFVVSGNNVDFTLAAGYYNTNPCNFKFTYSDNDIDNPLSVTATGSLTVQQKPNLPPVAVTDYFTVQQGQRFVAPVSQLLANDYDLENTTLIFNGIVCNDPGVTCIVPINLGHNDDQQYMSIDFGNENFSQLCGTLLYQYQIITPAGLTAIGSFSIQIVNCKCTNAKDIIFVLDGSSQTSNENFKEELQFAQNLVTKMLVSSNVWVGFVQFSDSASYDWGQRYGFTTEDAHGAVNKITKIQQFKSASGTSVVAGLLGAIDVGTQYGRNGVPKTVILITSSTPNSPCSCPDCQTTYSLYNGNQNNCSVSSQYYQQQQQYYQQTSSQLLTCNNCQWKVGEGDCSDSFGNYNNWCMPCADPRPIANLINSWTNPQWRIVSIINGHLPDPVTSVLKQCGYTSGNGDSNYSWKFDDLGEESDGTNSISNILDNACSHGCGDH